MNPIAWLAQLRVEDIGVDAELVAEILRQARTTRGERGHNVGGWRSDEHFTTWPTAQRTLHAIADVVVPSYAKTPTLRAWAVVHERGSYHDWHAHTGIAWRCSGVLYLTTGGAATLFRSPSASARVVPKKGTLLTFPSGVEHATEPHDELEPRITVAFNAS